MGLYAGAIVFGSCRQEGCGAWFTCARCKNKRPAVASGKIQDGGQQGTGCDCDNENVM